MPEITIDELPEDLQIFAEIGGIDRAIDYALELGGRPIYIRDYDGTNATLNDDMADIIVYFGQSNAEKLFQRLKSGYVLIPNCNDIIAKRRDAKIVEQRMNGEPIKALVIQYKLTSRTIYKVLERKRKAMAEHIQSNQRAMF